MSRVAIDSSRCQGHGICYLSAPDIFAYDDEGFGVVSVTGELDEQQLGQARLGADGCPERAISIQSRRSAS